MGREISTTSVAFDSYYQTQDIVPEGEWEAFRTTLETGLPTNFRVVSTSPFRKYVEEKLAEFDWLEELPWCQGAYQIDVPRNELRKDPVKKQFQEFLQHPTEVGGCFRQEAVSMLPYLLSSLKPGMSVLDMCAAPGSKTAGLIELSQGAEGSLVIANDLEAKRGHMLVSRLRYFDTAHLAVTCHAAQNFPDSFDAEGNRFLFDRILCDVPCSGDGTLRKNPSGWKKWHANEGMACHRLQWRILRRALELVKVGGRVIYSTCSLNPMENEAIVANLLHAAGGAAQLVDTTEDLPQLHRSPGIKAWKVQCKGQWYENFESVPEKFHNIVQESMFPVGDFPLERCVRVLPHQNNTGAFFVAVLEKVAPVPWDPVYKRDDESLRVTRADNPQPADDASRVVRLVKQSDWSRVTESAEMQKLAARFQLAEGDLYCSAGTEERPKKVFYTSPSLASWLSQDCVYNAHKITHVGTQLFERMSGADSLYKPAFPAVRLMKQVWPPVTESLSLVTDAATLAKMIDPSQVPCRVPKADAESMGVNTQHLEDGATITLSAELPAGPSAVSDAWVSICVRVGRGNLEIMADQAYRQGLHLALLNAVPPMPVVAVSPETGA